MSDIRTLSQHHPGDASRSSSYASLPSRKSKRTKKAEQNCQLQQQHPPFIVPDNVYRVFHIHHSTPNRLMNIILDHVQYCFAFTIDTESQLSSRRLALIQVQTLPNELPSFVILFELAHLPPIDSSLFKQLQYFFRLVFKPNNQIFSWGPLLTELSAALFTQLFEWPITDVAPIDIQSHFSLWYAWARSHCEVCDPSSNTDLSVIDIQTRTTIQSHVLCRCHEPSPYYAQEKWSLQKALAFSCHLFLDKSYTISRWTAGLDVMISDLSAHTRQHMISYAIYDCFAASYLIRPVLECWPFSRFQHIDFNNIFIFSTPLSIIEYLSPAPPCKPIVYKQLDVNKLGFIIEDVSDTDEEVYLAQCIIPSSVIVPSCDQASKSNDIADTVNSQPPTLQQQSSIISPPAQSSLLLTSDSSVRPSHHRNRNTNQTQVAKQRRNRKRNLAHRQHRYRYYITRTIYHRFTMTSIKNILRQYTIRYTNIKTIHSTLVIGVKNITHQCQFDQQLPITIFDRNHYYRLRRDIRRSS